MNLTELSVPLQSQHAVEFLVSTLSQANDPVTVVAVGPLTNLAVAIVQAPDIIENIAELLVMGGAISQGNITPSAEFNFYVDPHAAAIILSSGVNLTLFTLDLTHQIVTTPDRLATIRAIGNPVAIAAANMLEFYGRFDMERYGNPGGFLHDPCPVAYLIDPALFSGRPMHVQVETDSELTMGRSIVDCWQVTSKPANALVMETANAEGFYQLLCDRLQKFS